MTIVQTSGRTRSAHAAPPRWHVGSSAARGAVGTLALLGLAEVVVRTGLVDGSYFPTPTSVLVTMAELLVQPSFLADIVSTFSAAVLGLVIATAVAAPLGIVLGSSPVAHSAAKGIIELLRPIPSVALVPLAILVFGAGLEMKLSLILYASVWPILFNAIYGAHDVEPLAKDTARSFGVGRGAILLRVTLPHSLPLILTGVRVAAAIALVLAVSAEFLAGGADGLGAWLLDEQVSGAGPERIFAGVAVAGVLGLVLNAAIVLIERKVVPWKDRRA